MIVYSDGKWIATFDERGTLCKFSPASPVASLVSAFGVDEDSIITGKEGRKMIAQLRQPMLRIRCDVGEMKRTEPM